MKKLNSLILLLVIILPGCKETIVKQTPTENSTESSENRQENSLLSPDNFLNIAHRGASGHAPEHTLESYETGQKMTGNYIEIDLQMTKDGELIAMHDDDVSRTTNGKGKVKDFTLDEVKALDAGSWFNEENPDMAQPVFSNAQVPTLDEIIDRFGADANYYIETKTPDEYPGMVKELKSVLDKHGLIGPNVSTGTVIIQSFSKKSLKEVHNIDASIPLIQLITYKDTAEISNKEIKDIKAYAVGIGVSFRTLTKEYVNNVRDAGLLLHSYTVNKKADMERLISWGVTGIFTNYPDRLNDVLDEMDRVN